MADPSDYELRAWRDLQQFKGRRLSRVMGNASEQVATGAAELGKRATKYLENHVTIEEPWLSWLPDCQKPPDICL